MRNLEWDVYVTSVVDSDWSVDGGVGGPLDIDIFYCKIFRKSMGVRSEEGANFNKKELLY